MLLQNSIRRSSFLSRGIHSGTILNSSLSSSSSNQLNQPTYLPNNNGIFGQPQVNPNSRRTVELLFYEYLLNLIII